MHVREAASGASSYDNRYHIIVEDDAEGYLGFYLPNNGYAGIRFYDTTGQEGLIDYYYGNDEMHFHSSGTHIFKNAGTERLRITSGGNVKITSGVIENSNTISANYTVSSNYNAMSAGPMSISSGVSVTVPSGSAWTIV